MEQSQNISTPNDHTLYQNINKDADFHNNYVETNPHEEIISNNTPKQKTCQLPNITSNRNPTPKSQNSNSEKLSPKIESQNESKNKNEKITFPKISNKAKTETEKNNDYKYVDKYKVFIRPDGKPDFGNFPYFNDKVDFDPKKYRRPEIYFGFVHDQYIIPSLTKKIIIPSEDKNIPQEETKINNKKKKTVSVKKPIVKKNIQVSLDYIMNLHNLKYIEPPVKPKEVPPPVEEEEAPPEEEDKKGDKNKKPNDKGKASAAQNAKGAKK